MVLDIDPTDAIKVESSNPTDEPEITLQWVKDKSQAGHDL